MSLFPSYRFLRWWAPFRQELRFFQLSVGVKASVVESQQMSSFVSISFHRLLFYIHFLSCSFHVAFVSFHSALISLHFALTSFHVPSLNWSGVYLPKRERFFHISLSFLLSFSYRLGGLCRLPSGFMNTHVKVQYHFFSYSYRFLGRQCIGSVKVQAKPKWNARSYCTIPFIIIYLVSKCWLQARWQPSWWFHVVSCCKFEPYKSERNMGISQLGGTKWTKNVAPVWPIWVSNHRWSRGFSHGVFR